MSKESIRYSRINNSSLAHDSSMQMASRSRCSQIEGSGGPKSAQRYNNTGEFKRKIPFNPSKEDLVIDQYNTTAVGNLVAKPAFCIKKNYSVTSNKKSNMSQRYEEFNDEDEEEEQEELEIGLESLADKFGMDKLMDTLARMSKKDS